MWLGLTPASLVAMLVVGGVLFIACYLIDTYFNSWVYVIVDWSDRNYGFFINTVSTAVCGLAIFSGLIIRYTHRYKYIQIVGLCTRTMCVKEGIWSWARILGYQAPI
ncbi:hypothetical protein CC85DRAFT_313214 [Cutaneotrichosporon oleaginosum]|uniref:Uncharacterized protein n=1 Tax=Cutaneotrichosporon oleaginosum TaxID=879819 RepID=A0A0J0XHM1_9TREE|nr:uncharacterized protein CC85DRAFT_313214 [Cutaneotrichosporon oleaginosum]KLT40563.1 hypothetical protein CC85DRAFT_313214 [Cutaneotrichosporon oleaginosum]